MDQISNSEVDIGMGIIQKILDRNEKKRISFECYKNSDFIFKKVKKFIEKLFFKVGKTSLFDLKYQKSFSPAA